MLINNFWNHIIAIEDDYAFYRKKVLARFMLTAAECDILLFLANNPLCDTAAEISRIRRIPKSQVSLSVNSLYEKGLLCGRKAPNNRKSVHLTPTEAAEPVIAYGREIQQAFSRMLFEDFTEDEKVEFLHLFKKLAETAEKQKGKEPWRAEL